MTPDTPATPVPDTDSDRPTPAQLLDIAVSLAEESSALVRRMRGQLGDALAGTVRTKSSAVDPVTAVDEASESLLRRRIAEVRPGDVIYGEEGGGATAADAAPGAVRWVLDPIDGTVNFLYGVPAYAVSIAAEVDGRVVAAAVADVARGAIYSAAVGHGARVTTAAGTRELNGPRATGLGATLVATGFSYDSARRARQGRVGAMLLGRVRDIRRIGSAALDLCLLADGAVDAYYEHGLAEWDWAAGALIAEEAGARVRRPEVIESAAGEPIIAAAPAIWDEFTTAMAEVGADQPFPAGEAG